MKIYTNLQKAISMFRRTCRIGDRVHIDPRPHPRHATVFVWCNTKLAVQRPDTGDSTPSGIKMPPTWPFRIVSIICYIFVNKLADHGRAVHSMCVDRFARIIRHTPVNTNRLCRYNQFTVMHRPLDSVGVS